jgi:hypothetical protein
MKRKALILLSSLFVSGVAAASGNVYMGKYPVADVQINGASLNGENPPAFIVNNTTMLPLESAAEKMGAFVQKDEATGQISLIKPNVNMIVASEIGETERKDYQIKSPFMVVSKGNTVSFDIFADIDNVPKIDSIVFKIVVRSSSGTEEYVSYPQSYSTARNGTAFLYTHHVKGLKFKQSGDYKVQLIMKEGSSGEYRMVGENIIHSQ